jgi:hypothetical protein
MKYLAILILLCGAAFGQCGWKNDSAIHIPANYPTPFTPPAINASYTDVTGCTATRVTNGVTQHAGNGVNVLYNTVTVFSADNLYVMGGVRGAGAVEIYRVSDKQIVVPLNNVPSSGFGSVRWAGPINTGKALDGHTLYYFKDNGIDTLLYKATFTDSGCAPSCTITSTLLHTFTGYTGQGNTGAGLGAIQFAGGEADVSDDGNYTVLDDDPSGQYAIHPRTLVYRFSDDTVTGLSDWTSSGTRPNGASMMHNNTVIIDWTLNNIVCTPITTECYAGGEWYQSDMTFIKQIVKWANHYHTGWYGSALYYIAMDANDNFCNNGQHGGVAIVDVTTLATTCLVSSSNSSISGGLGSRNGWVQVYTQDMRSAPSTNTYPLAGSWASMWRYYENEMLLISLAPAHDVYRLIQTRTCPGPQADYWKEAFGSLSRDATLMAYGTDFCQNSASGYTDMMLINLSGGGSQIQPQTLVKGIQVQ